MLFTVNDEENQSAADLSNFAAVVEYELVGHFVCCLFYCVLYFCSIALACLRACYFGGVLL